MKSKEQNLQMAVTNYIKLIGRGSLLFTCDLSGVFVKNKNQAMKLSRMRSHKGVPDVMIFEPRKGYHGLFIELKAESPYLKSGKLSRSKHIQEQNNYMEMLRERGYKAEFAVGFDEAKKIIDTYF